MAHAEPEWGNGPLAALYIRNALMRCVFSLKPLILLLTLVLAGLVWYATLEERSRSRDSRIQQLEQLLPHLTADQRQQAQLLITTYCSAEDYCVLNQPQYEMLLQGLLLSRGENESWAYRKNKNQEDLSTWLQGTYLAIPEQTSKYGKPFTWRVHEVLFRWAGWTTDRMGQGVSPSMTKDSVGNSLSRLSPGESAP